MKWIEGRRGSGVGWKVVGNEELNMGNGYAGMNINGQEEEYLPT